MGRTVPELLASVSSYELAEWMAFERLEPWGFPAGNVLSARQCSLLHNIHRGKDVPPAKLSDYYLDYLGPYQTRKEEDQERTVRSIGTALTSSAPRGAIRCYTGSAPAIKRIGKAGKHTKSKERLWRILYGKSGKPGVPGGG